MRGSGGCILLVTRQLVCNGVQVCLYLIPRRGRGWSLRNQGAGGEETGDRGSPHSPHLTPSLSQSRALVALHQIVFPASLHSPTELAEVPLSGSHQSFRSGPGISAVLNCFRLSAFVSICRQPRWGSYSQPRDQE